MECQTPIESHGMSSGVASVASKPTRVKRSDRREGSVGKRLVESEGPREGRCSGRLGGVGARIRHGMGRAIVGARPRVCHCGKVTRITVDDGAWRN